MKKIIRIIITVVVLLVISASIYLFLTKQDSKTTLTILEKQWIENNKNTMQDFAIMNNQPVFNHDGEGLLQDFLTSLETTTGLEFNKMSYSYGTEIPSNYAFMITEEKEKNSVIIYQDNYVIITKDKNKVYNINDLENMIIGVTKEKLEAANLYLNLNKTLSFTSYDDMSTLIKEFENDSTKLDGIIIPKTMYLETIIKNNYRITYNITEMTQDYIIRLGDNQTLNTIIKKYFKKWYNENYTQTFGKYFTQNYFSFSNINNDSQVKFKSKQYKYGFVDMEPYDKLVNGKLLGINREVMKTFSTVADIEIAFTQYNSLVNVQNAFNENKIDFMFNFSTAKKYDMDTVETVSLFDEQAVVLLNNKNPLVINSLNSLLKNKVITITNSKISKYIEKSGIEAKKYKNIQELISKIDNNSILVIDEKVYNMYEHTKLKNYIVRYKFDIDTEYNYIIRDISENETFAKYFNFYLSFINDKEIINSVNYDQFTIEQNNQTLKNIVITLLAILILLVITILVKITKIKQKKNNGVSKENKLKYIDMLTSLKNRNYLNDSIEKWDATDIYPQTIIIVDLNNIAYINDNYGHSEGDSVITEAANILIKNQLEQTEIMRTNGNEFLIYLVGYEEKQIVAYIRKLNKEFKELAHGFGAAIGYSMIVDGLKTVDDAINEATLDMRAIKEETND